MQTESPVVRVFNTDALKEPAEHTTRVSVRSSSGAEPWIHSHHCLCSFHREGHIKKYHRYLGIINHILSMRGYLSGSSALR